MQTGGIRPGAPAPALVRIPAAAVQSMANDLFVPGRLVEAQVLSRFADRAILLFGKGIRLEAELQVPLQEGQRVRLQVQTQPGVEESPQLILKLLDHGESAQPGNAAAGQSVLTWLPIPLPQGGQGWVQLQIQEEAEAKRQRRGDGPAHQVKLWWETPALGPVQASLDAAGLNLTAIFTVALEASRAHLDAELTDLRARLNDIGFTELNVGCRPTAPGETLRPNTGGEPLRLDRRV